MAITLTWPLTSDGAGAVTYTANDWRTLLTNLFDEGILGASSFEVSERAAGANMTLDVTAGVAVVEGDDAAGQGNYLVEASETLGAFTIDTADASNPRIDRVGIQLNDPSEGGSAGRNCTFVVVKGTAAASPSAPTLPDSFLELAQVTVPAAATSIEDADITDTRTIARLTHEVVNTASIDGDAVTTAKIADDAVTSDKLAAASTGSLDSGNLRYARIGDVVSVWTTSDSSGGTLPAGFRPAAGISVPGSSSADVAVTTGGVVSVDVGGSPGSATFAFSFAAA